MFELILFFKLNKIFVLYAESETEKTLIQAEHFFRRPLPLTVLGRATIHFISAARCLETLPRAISVVFIHYGENVSIQISKLFFSTR